jgi:hypothetical protein
MVEVEGTRLFTHKEKERVFTNFYWDLLGKSSASLPLIDFDELYPEKPNLSH